MTSSPTSPPSVRLYRALLLLLILLIAGFYLACIVSGVIRLCFYDDLSGLGLMVVGLLLYQAARLALAAYTSLRPSLGVNAARPLPENDVG